MIYDNVLQAMGHTPLVRLNRLSEANAAQILVKFEGVNVGGSIKTRTALQMIESAERRGEIGPDSIIVEPTSGNQGIGLALVCAVRGYRARIIMPDSVSEERRKLVRHYGAEVIVVHDAGDIGECISKCIALAKRMASEDPRVYVPQQFENRDNLLAHRYHTALEILEDVKGPIHGFCSGIGTGGTISGIGQALKRLFLMYAFGPLSRRAQRFFREEASERICRWVSAMGLFPISLIRASMTISAWFPMRKLSTRLARLLVRRVCFAAYRAVQMWLPHVSLLGNLVRARQWLLYCPIRANDIFPLNCLRINRHQTRHRISR